MYGFEDAVDVDAWRKLGAEAIVKVAARKVGTDQIQVFGHRVLDEQRQKAGVREEPHRQEDRRARHGASHHRCAARRAHGAPRRLRQRAHVLGALGQESPHLPHGRRRQRACCRSPIPKDTAIAPAFGPGNKIFYLVSREYAPFSLATYVEPEERGRRAAVQDVALRRVAQPGRHAAGAGRRRARQERDLRG